MALSLPVDAGPARLVDIALTDIPTSYVGVNCPFYIHHNKHWRRSRRRAPDSGGAYPFVILPCKDGQVCLSGRTRREWERLVEAIGTPDLTQQPRYQRLRAMGQEYPEEVVAQLAPILAGMTKAELAQMANEHGLTISPVRTLDEVLETPQFARRGFLKEQELGGRTVKAPGLPFARNAESCAEDAANSARDLLSDVGRPPAGPTDPQRPLKGLRVLTSTGSGLPPVRRLSRAVRRRRHQGRARAPARQHAALGHGLSRRATAGARPAMFHQINRGKRSITLNVMEPGAIELLMELAGQSDMIIENMSPGSLERSRLG